MKQAQLLFILLISLLSGCTDGEQSLKDQTIVQAKEGIKAENKNREDLAKPLLDDLRKRRAFINAIEGEYQGKFAVMNSSYMMRVLIVATIPEYDVKRIKTLPELEYELQNLNLNIQILQWNPMTQLSAVGCILEGIKPDLKRGILNIISENCSNTYQLLLSENNRENDMYEESENLASLIRDGRIESVEILKGKMRSSTNAKIYSLSLERI